MRRKRKDEYHLLIAQNFLGNISLTGRHDDTRLRIFNSPGYQGHEFKPELALPVAEETPAVKFDLKTVRNELRVVATAPEMGSRKSLASPSNDEDPFSQSYPSVSFPRAKHKKTPNSIIRRFVKILSSDDVMSTRERRLKEEYVPLTTRSQKDPRRRESMGSTGRPPSPIIESQFLFFRKIRTSIGKGERNYLCSNVTFGPFAVVSHFPFITAHEQRHRLNRSHSTLATSLERMRRISQCSVEELKPYDFPDEDIEISFGYLFGRRRDVSPCGPITAHRRSDRRDSQYVDSMPRMADGEASDTLGTMTTLYAREASYEPDEIEWDEVQVDNYSPSIFEDIEASRRTIIRSPGFVGVTLHTNNPELVKTQQNQLFAEKYPTIDITFSKYKSIIKDISLIAGLCDFDLTTTAQALVFFERIIHKGLICKSNRKLVAGASLLVAMKMNDHCKESIKELIDAATEKLRVSRKDLIALEIPLCAALNFELQSSPEHVAKHYYRLLIASADAGWPSWEAAYSWLKHHIRPFCSSSYIMSFLNDSRYGPDITDTSAPFFPGLVLIYEPYYIRINAFLSRGTFGEVFSVSIDGYRRRFAMKTIPLISETRAEDISHEIKIVNLLYKNRSYKHHIVRFELAFKHENRGINYGCLLMERMGCSLFEFLQCRSFQPFPLEEVKVVGKQILKALKHIHKLGIVHTDVKPSNILCALLTRDLQVKLADFGNAEMIEDLKLVDEPIQSMGFRAPEVVLGLPLDERMDIFSLGAVLGEIYSGKQLFPVFDDFQLTRLHFELIGTPSNGFEGTRWEQMYKVDPRTAKFVPRVEDVTDWRQYEVKHLGEITKYGRTEDNPKHTRWFVEALEELLSADLYRRPTAKEALRLPFFKN